MGQSGLKIRLPYFLPRGASTPSVQQSSASDCISMAQQKNKRSIDDLEDSNRERKRKRSSKESISTVQFALRPAAEDSHDSIFPVTSNSPRVDIASALTHNQDPIPTANVGHTSAIACQSHRIAIPSKRSCPFGKDVPRKRRKKESYVIVRAYKQRKDLEHTDEVECALTPDGDLDLVSVSRKLSVRECQASRFNAIPFCGPCSLLLEGPRRPLFTAMV
jgi:hypothetical protein